MANLFEIEDAGKSQISSHLTRCDFCKRLTLLSTYSTTQFLKFLNIPIFVVGKQQVVNECALCGNRGITSGRKYNKERKRNLALVNKRLTADSKNSDNCAFALHTLMVYDMEERFREVLKEYGLQFETHMHIQYLIAQGLSRFGNYKEASIYCRKAMVLGAAKPAQQLLEFCDTMMETAGASKDLEALKPKDESALKFYIPQIIINTLLVAGLITFSSHLLKEQKAWIVNGTLQSYTFSIDDQSYTLKSGATQEIPLRLGEHMLRLKGKPDFPFTYSASLMDQISHNQLLVINPDATALLAFSESEDGTSDTQVRYSHEGRIRIFPNLKIEENGLRKISPQTKQIETIGLYRPDTHWEMVLLMQNKKLLKAAGQYARAALLENPDTPETTKLLQVALQQQSDAEKLNFLRKGLRLTPTLLPWHLQYQAYMQDNHPETDLTEEYTARCEQNLNEPESRYLLARILKNRVMAYRLYAASDEKNGMKGLGLFAAARELYLRGNYATALPYAQRAMQQNPGNPAYANLRNTLLLATKDYRTLLKELLTLPKDSIPREKFLHQEILYLTGAGFHSEANKIIEQLPKEDSDLKRHLNAIRFYVVGNLSDYLDCLNQMSDPKSVLIELLHTGKIDQAEKLIAASGAHPYWEHLIAYCVAAKLNETDIAERQMKLAFSILSSAANPSLHQLGTLLQDPKKIDTDTIIQMDIEAQEKAVVLTALGFLLPERQESFFLHANTYNFAPTYPQLLLNKWIGNAQN